MGQTVEEDTFMNTLKDFEDVVNNEDIKLFLIPLIRDEGIMWIQQLQKKSGNDSVIVWIKHFFNITEEDLNWQKKRKGQ